MRAVTFGFDDPTLGTFEGVTDDTRWNGFLNVCVTPSEAQRIIDHWQSLDDEFDLEQSIEDIKDLMVHDADGLVKLGYCLATLEVER